MKKVQIMVLILSCITLFGCSGLHESKKVNPGYEFGQSGIDIQIDVLLPDSYEENPNKIYPVVYVLDGYWNKESMKGVVSNLLFDNMIPELIIVSIGYPQAIVDVANVRMNDLTPKYDKDFGTGGDASVMLEILTGQAIPYLENTYRIDSNRSILLGHSLAGLFTLYSMYQNPTNFTHYAAISPSALWSNGVLLELDQIYAQKNSALSAKAYITYGTDEYAPYVDILKNYIDQLKNRQYQDLDLTLATVADLRHVGMKSEGYIRAMVWAFSDMELKGPSGFETLHLEAFKNQSAE